MSMLGNIIRRTSSRRRIGDDPWASTPVGEHTDPSPPDRDDVIFDGEDAHAELEDLETGVRVHYQDGRLWINDVDVHMATSLYLARPTRHARAYVEGLRTKLNLILARTGSSRRTHSLHEEITRTLQLLTDVLARTPAVGVFCLPACAD